MPQRLEGAKIHKAGYKPISAEEERIGKIIVNAAYNVHKTLGPGLLEKVYEACFAMSLEKLNYE